MDANYVRERVASLRREMQDLQELHARNRAQHHGHLNRLSYELCRTRLQEIKAELATMLAEFRRVAGQ
jgi:hypothetical protein